MRDLSSILSLVRNELNKFSNTGARMLDNIYHMALNNFKIAFYARLEKFRFFNCVRNVVMDIITYSL